MIIVKLTKFDTIPHKQFTNIVPVILNNNPNNSIGYCKLVRNKNGQFYGELNLDSGDYGDFYFSYLDNTQNGLNFVLDFINLSEAPGESQTTKLKDIVVKSID